MSDSVNPLIFIIDSNTTYQKITTQFINIAGYCETIGFSDYSACLDFLDLEPDIIISEYTENPNPINGQLFFEIVKEQSPETMLIFLSSKGEIENAVGLIHKGAVDYILKSKVAHEKIIDHIQCISRYKEDILKNNMVRKRLTASIGILVAVLAGLIFLYNN